LCCLISLSIISCSKDNDSFQEDGLVKDGLVEEYQVTTNSQSLSSDDYLSTKYSENYAVIEVLRAEIEGENLVLKKVRIANSENKEVFTVENENNEILHFAEIDWQNGLYESFNFQFQELSTEYIDSEGGFIDAIRGEDLVSILDNPDNAANGGGNSPRFFGWSCGGTYELVPNSGNYYRTCCHRIMGIENGCSTYSTGNLPGRNPKILAP